MMEEAKRSLWSRSLLVRVLTYSVGSSIFMVGVNAYYTRNVSLPGLATSEEKLRAFAGTAFSVFRMVFPVAAAILGTIHSFISLIKYRRVASRGDKELETAARISHDLPS